MAQHFDWSDDEGEENGARAAAFLCKVSADAEPALASPLWDADFWDAMEDAEKVAAEALDALIEYDLETGAGCSCSTCIVRTVLEAVWPTITTHATAKLASTSEVQTIGAARGGCCGGRCRREA